MRSLRLFVISGVLLLAFAPTTSALAQASGTWAATRKHATVSTAGAATTTLLQNGQVLVVGGGAGRVYERWTCTTRPRGLGPPPADDDGALVRFLFGHAAPGR